MGSSGNVSRATAYVIVATLGAVVALLAWQLVSPAGLASAQSAASASSANGPVTAIAGQLTKDNYGLYLIDAQSGTICVYQYFPSDRKLRLMSARAFLFDRQLDEYNTEPPLSEINDLVRNARRVKDVTPASQP